MPRLRRRHRPKREITLMASAQPAACQHPKTGQCSRSSTVQASSSGWVSSLLMLMLLFDAGPPGPDVASVVVIVLRPGSGEVSGFFLSLCLPGLDVLQLASVEDEVNGFIPAQVGMLVEELADLVFEVGGDFNVVLVRHLFLQIVERVLDLLAFVEGDVSVGEQLGARHYLLYPVRLELCLDHLDECVAGQSVDLNTLVEEDRDLFVRRAVLAQLCC